MAYLDLLTPAALIIDDGLDAMNTAGRIGNASGGCQFLATSDFINSWQPSYIDN